MGRSVCDPWVAGGHSGGLDTELPDKEPLLNTERIAWLTDPPPLPPHGSGQPGGSSAFSPLAELPAAIDAGQLTLLYQPKIDLATSQVSGVEALIRWQHPRHGLIEPSGFVPLLERAGAIGPLTDWVIDTAVAQLERWFDEQMPLDVSINVTSSDLLDPRLADILSAAVFKHHVPPDSVRLELGHCMQPEDGPQRVRAARHLERIGVSLSLDDYGTQHSSLLDVKDLPVDELKIDRLYIHDMMRERRVKAIVQSTIDLGRALGVAVVAEGIEDATQWHLLKRMGCSHGQGYLFSPPLSSWALAAWLQRWPYGCSRRQGSER
jgi:EAL domain-containing protein (putative c-di-GMP-specific phosphodiesterase class I)